MTPPLQNLGLRSCHDDWVEVVVAKLTLPESHGNCPVGYTAWREHAASFRWAHLTLLEDIELLFGELRARGFASRQRAELEGR